MIVVDSSPLLITTDPLILSKLVDGIVMVVSSGRTHIASLARALESIKAVSSHCLGIVLNNFDLRTAAGYYQYRNSYKYYRTQSYGNILDKPAENDIKKNKSHKERKAN
jgi:Mrp family chromosome partitioning ATPase